MAKQQPWRRIYLPPLCLLLLLAGIETSDAEPKAAAPGGDALRKAQGLIRQLSQEKQALETEKTAWLGEKAALEGQLQTLQQQVRLLPALQEQVERYKAGLEAVRGNLEGQLAQQRQREQALVQKHNEVVAKARDIRDDNQLLVQAVQEREQWIAQCAGLNQQLRELNQKVVDGYEQKGLWQQLAELEPITGIAKVDTQNRAEEYRYQLKQLKVTPFEATVSRGGDSQPVVEPSELQGGAEQAVPAGTSVATQQAAEPVPSAEVEQ